MCPWPLLFWSHLLVPMSMSREQKSLLVSKSPLFTARIGRAAPKKISTFEAPNCRFQLILTKPSSQNMSAKSLILRRARTCVNTMMGAEGCSPRSPHARCRCRRALTATSTVACGQSEQRHLLQDEGAAIMRKNAAACAASTIRGTAAL